MNKDELIRLVQHDLIDLRPSQPLISIPIVLRIYKKMKLGLKFDSIQVADQAVIVNGHHRYLASLLTNTKLEMTQCPLTSAKTITNWSEVQLVEEDWDTPEHIMRLNTQDAQYNNIDLVRLLEMIA